MKNERSLYWCLVLYPDEDPKHQYALDYIIKNFPDYAYIIHDKDILDNGDLKKTHCHIVLRFKNYRWKNAIAEELKITSNYLEKCRNLENALKYLIHFNNEDKFQYDIELVKGTLKNKLIQYINNNDKNENEKVLDLIEYIDNYDGFLKISTFVRYCCNVGMYDIYRRSATSFIKIIEEHNYFKKEY